MHQTIQSNSKASEKKILAYALSAMGLLAIGYELRIKTGAEGSGQDTELTLRNPCQLHSTLLNTSPPPGGIFSAGDNVGSLYLSV
jgi:hypothetical protein